MSKTQNILDIIHKNYNPTKLIKQSKVKQIKKRIIKEAKEQAKALAKQQAQKQLEKEKAKFQLSSSLDESEKSFITKFIEYNELLLLSDECQKLTPIFQKALGENAQFAIKAIEQKCKERQDKLNELAKELTEIKQNLQKEAEKVKTKESLISLASNISQVKARKTADDEFNSFNDEMPKNAGNIVESKKKKK